MAGMDRIWKKVCEGDYKNDHELYHLLKQLVLKGEKSKEKFPDSAAKVLLELLESRHSAEVWLLVTTLISNLCNSTPTAKQDLAIRGAVSSLIDVLQTAVADFSKTPKGSHSSEIYEQLIEHVTSMMHYFSQGPQLCIRKLLRIDVFSSLASMIDINEHKLFVNGVGKTKDMLESLVLKRALVGCRQTMLAGVSEMMYCLHVGIDVTQCRMNLASSSFVLDVYDTSGESDVCIVKELYFRCGVESMWLYDEESDQEMDGGNDESEEWVDVYVTHVVDGAYFWAVLGATEKVSFDKIQSRLHELAETGAMKQMLPGVSHSEETVYAVRKHSEWYRARVIGSDGKRNVKVFAIDLGVVDVIPVTDLYLPVTADHDVVLTTKALSNLCKLKGVQRNPACRNAFLNILGTLCNVTDSDMFWQRLAQAEEDFVENGLPGKLLHLATCPDIELQILVFRLYSNMARVQKLRPLLGRCGICPAAIEVVQKKLPTTHWSAHDIQLVEACLCMVANLLFRCPINKQRLEQLEGLPVVMKLCVEDIPVQVRTAARKAVKEFIGEATYGIEDIDAMPEPVILEPAPVRKNRLLDTVDVKELDDGIKEVECKKVSPEITKKYVLGQVLPLIDDGEVDLQRDLVEEINRDTVTELISAFLNTSSGGTIYYGISPISNKFKSVVKGVKMSRSMRDRVRLSIDKLVVQCISPTIAPMHTVTTYLFEVFCPEKNVPINDLYVIEIVVKRPPSLTPTLYTCVYGIERHGFVRVGPVTQRLTSKDIYAWTLENLEKAKIESIAEAKAEVEILRSLVRSMS